MKRASIGIALLVSGFLAGLVLTGRLRSADESTAQTVQRPGADRRDTRGCRNARRPSRPHRHRGAGRQRRRQHLVGAGRSPAEFSVRQRSVLRIFLRRPRRYVRIPRSARAKPRVGRADFRRRLRRDEQPRHRQREGRVTVIFSDKHEAPARIIGIDKATDLALVKVDKPAQPPLKWGDSSQTKVAEWVLAIGSPYQLSHSVSLGIISALGRKNLGFSEYEDFIQTDAAINRGNSGGALVNARGELIGINTGIFSSSQNGGSEGIGFAIPSNLARQRHRRDHRARRRAARLARPDDPVSADDADGGAARRARRRRARSSTRSSAAPPPIRQASSPATSSFPSTARRRSIPATSSGSSPMRPSAARRSSSSFARAGGSRSRFRSSSARGNAMKARLALAVVVLHGVVASSRPRSGCRARRFRSTTTST